MRAIFIIALLGTGSPSYADGLENRLRLTLDPIPPGSNLGGESSRAVELEKAGRRYRRLGIGLTIVAVAATIAGGVFLLARDYSGGFGGTPSAQQRNQADTFGTLAEASLLTAGGTSIVGAISWASGGQMIGEAERLRESHPTAALSWTWDF